MTAFARPIVYPVSRRMRFRTIARMVLGSLLSIPGDFARAACARAAARLRQPALLAVLGIGTLAFMLSGQPGHRQKMVTRLQTSPTPESVLTSIAAPQTKRLSESVIAPLAVPNPPVMAVGPTETPPAAVIVSKAIAPNKPAVDSSAPAQQLSSSAVERPRYPVPPTFARSAFDQPPPIPTTGGKVKPRAWSGARAIVDTAEGAKASDAKPAIDVEIRTAPKMAAAEVPSRPSIESTPDYRAVTTNDDALVIRLGNGSFQEIRTGQKLPGGETLKSVNPAGDSFSTDVGIFYFSTKGVSKP